MLSRMAELFFLWWPHSITLSANIGLLLPLKKMITTYNSSYNNFCQALLINLNNKMEIFIQHKLYFSETGSVKVNKPIVNNKRSKLLSKFSRQWMSTLKWFSWLLTRLPMLNFSLILETIITSKPLLKALSYLMKV